MPTKKKKNLKKQSAFKPSKKRSYQVIIGNEINNFIPQTPLHSKQIKQSKRKKEKLNENEMKRKKWSKELKQKAIEIGKLMGLSKATRYLQQSDDYKELRTSTLYYWLKTNDIDSVIN